MLTCSHTPRGRWCRRPLRAPPAIDTSPAGANAITRVAVAAVAAAEAAGAAAGLAVAPPVAAAVGPQGRSQRDREVSVALLPKHGGEWCGG